jgi:hypothetical protein
MRRALPARVILVLCAAVAMAFGGCGTKSSSSSAGAARTGDPPPGKTAPRAHPQAVEPTAGVALPTQSSDTARSAPVGDPTAHAPSLAEVKRELKIMNLCGGTTNPALAAPLIASSGPGFRPDPGTVQSVGQLPLLTSRLDALAKSLGVTIFGISGYRTPAHSVAVGGFADDPHTKGEAEDIGVGSLLRSSAAQISESQLAQFGLYRPFDPADDPNNPEVNHIQLIPASGALSIAQASARWKPDPRCR